MKPAVTDGVVVLPVTSMSADLSAVIWLTPRIKVTSASVIQKGSSDFYISRLWVYLRSIEVVTLKLSVARFEKAIGHDSLNVKVAEVATGFANARVVSRSSEGTLN